MKLCSVEGCGLKHKAKGFCHKHYVANAYRNDPHAAAKARQKRAKNPSVYKAADKRYYDAHKQEIATRSAEYRARNADCKREYNAAYYVENREKLIKLNSARRYRTVPSSYVRACYGVDKNCPTEMIEIYRLVLQIKREANK